MPMDWDPDYIAMMFMRLMFSAWTRDELAYLHITVMHPSYEA